MRRRVESILLYVGLRVGLRVGLGLAVSAIGGCDRPAEVESNAPPEETERRTFVLDEPFPTQAELDRIASAPIPTGDAGFGPPLSAADTWTMRSAGAQQLEPAPYLGDDPMGQAIFRACGAAGGGTEPIASMQCVAEEVGQFVLEHGAKPAPDILGFIAARCGSLTASPFVAVIDQPDEATRRWPLAPKKLGELADTIVAEVPPGTHLGAWVGKKGPRAVLVTALSRPTVEVEPVDLEVSAGHIDFRGKVSWEYEAISGVATKGDLGFAHCRPIREGAASSPAFALRCPVDGSSTTGTRIEIVSRAKGELLSRSVLATVVARPGGLPREYAAPSLSLPTQGGHDLVSVVTGVNHLRRAAGLRPIAASEAQTEVAQALLPHLLAALDAGDHANADLVTLGLIAGRRVEEHVAGAGFFSFSHPEVWSLDRTLAALLASPGRRAAMLAPEAAVLAHAELSDEERGVRRTLVATYEVYEDRDYSAETAAVFDSIDRQRVALGLEPVLRVEGPNDRKRLEATAHRVRDGKLMPDEGLDELTKHFANETHRSFRGLMVFPWRLEGFDPAWEGRIVQARKVAAAVTISHFVPTGAAWGRHLIYVVYTEL